MLAVPAAASADQPDGSSYIVNESSLAAQDMRENGLDSASLSIGDGPFKGSATGEYASRVKHNGWYK